jgi:septal ring factor EnvC (AmiA/AmiB activator)
MINVEILQKQIQQYRTDIDRAVQRRDQLAQMLNQQEQGIQQLLGGIAALEEVLKKEAKQIQEEAKNVGTQNPTDSTESKIAC